MIPGFETIFIKAGKWLFDKFGKEGAKKAGQKIGDKIKLGWQSFNAKKAAGAYAEKIKQLYSITQIWQMASPRKLNDSEGIYTHVNLLEKVSAFCREHHEQLKDIYLENKGFGEIKEKRLAGEEAVKNHHKLFILGKPGAGKTTFLKHLTLFGAEGALKEWVPIFIPLREFSESGLSLKDFMIKQFDICDFPDAWSFIEKILSSGSGLILFDGLDEVNREEGLRETVIGEIKDLSRKYSESRYVITCRVAATEYNFEGFTYVEMADFSEEQIKVFVKKWFGEDEKGSAGFLKEFESSRGEKLRDLAKNPLLLTLLCISYHETLEFPDRRSEIYGEALDALLKKWDTSRSIKRDNIYGGLSLGRKNQMFTRIGAETFEEEKYLFSREFLAGRVTAYLETLPGAEAGIDIDGEEIVREIEAQHGTFCQRARNLYTFSHLTFQEYYTARYVVTDYKTRTRALIQNHMSDPKWREVFLLTAEMLDDAGEFFDCFREAIDDVVRTDERLWRFLKFVDKKAEGELPGKTVMEKRVYSMVWSFRIGILIYCVALARACDFALALNSDYYYDRDYDRDLIISLSLARAHNFFHDFDGDLDFNRDLAYIYTRILAFLSGIEIRSNPDENIQRVLDKFEDREELFRRLRSLKVSENMKAKEDWINLTSELKDIILTFFPTGEYEFSNEEVERLSKYLEILNLMANCLKVASLNKNKRQEIRDWFLRPPSNT